jgi:pyruvate dehydrogenase E2 component (dihydrolipoamide acetyltransferase)
LKLVVAEGETVPVAEAVGWIGEPGEAVPSEGSAPADPVVAAEPTASPAPVSSQTSADDSQPVVIADSVPTISGTGGRVKASPVARKIAEQRGIDLSSITGSGPEGRVIKRDVESAQPIAAITPAATGATGPAFVEIPLSQMRKTIAKRLIQSIGPVPTFYLTAEADMERAAEARATLLASDPDGRFSFNDIIIRAAAEALKQHPWVNSWWMDDKIRQWNEVNIGVAVAIDGGLITPIVRNADTKSLREINGEVRELAGRARAKKLAPEEYTGASFSISNLGMFGIDEFTAIINPPEVAILAVGRMAPKPVVVDGEVVVRRRMRMTLSCDHRVIDGATGAEFLKTLVGMLENPLALVW